METQKIPHYVKPTLGRLHSGDVIVCQISESKEAFNGYLYYTSRDARPVGGGNLSLAERASSHHTGQLWSARGMPANLSAGVR